MVRLAVQRRLYWSDLAIIINTVKSVIFVHVHSFHDRSTVAKQGGQGSQGVSLLQLLVVLTSVPHNAHVLAYVTHVIGMSIWLRFVCLFVSCVSRCLVEKISGKTEKT